MEDLDGPHVLATGLPATGQLRGSAVCSSMTFPPHSCLFVLSICAFAFLISICFASGSLLAVLSGAALASYVSCFTAVWSDESEVPAMLRARSSCVQFKISI